MEVYEIDPDKIFAWAGDYASYEDLEKVAKGLYGMYVQQRKNYHPKDHGKNKKLKYRLNK